MTPSEAATLSDHTADEEPPVQSSCDPATESPAMCRLRMVAGDAGKHVTRHAFIKPDEAAAILAEIEQMRLNHASTAAGAAGRKPLAGTGKTGC